MLPQRLEQRLYRDGPAGERQFRRSSRRCSASTARRSRPADGMKERFGQRGFGGPAAAAQRFDRGVGTRERRIRGPLIACAA